MIGTDRKGAQKGKALPPRRQSESRRRREIDRRATRKLVVVSRPRNRTMGLRGTRADKSPLVARKLPVRSEPTACPFCRAVFWHKSWRRSRARTLRSLIVPTPLAVCPACRQVRRGDSFGHVVLRGRYVAGHQDEILRRIRNVAARARFTQPERRIVSIRRDGEALHIRTTSQKLAHRIARELEKAFGGHASYAWSGGDGRLDAVWEREEPPQS